MKQKLFFSIIIPTYNRPEQLAQCLEAIACLDYPKENFEVIVVDDGSKTSLKRAIEPSTQQINLTLIKQDNAGPATARNTGATQARGQYLAFTDDDCIPTPDWLSNLAAGFATAPETMIGGRTINQLENNPYSTASQLLIDCLYSYHQSSPQRAKSNFFTANNLALPSQIFHSIGGFDTDFSQAAGEDREFGDRWLHHGYEMIYAPEVIVYHAHHLTLPTFWRQHFNYGRGAFYFLKARASRTDESLEVEPLKFVLTLFSYPFQQKYSQPVIITALLIVSQLADIAGNGWERFKVYCWKKLVEFKPKTRLDNLGLAKK